MNVKICGITNKEDAMNAIALGADAIGFIFTSVSPRYISPEAVEEISIHLPPFTRTVGVFLDQSKDEIDDIVERCKLDLIQLHGNESPDFCMTMKRRVLKAFRISEIDDIAPIGQYQGLISAAVLDTKVDEIPGGTGQCFDWGIALKAQEDFDIPIILAGGITPKNLKKAIELVNPYAVDISSGVESEVGQKDYNAMEEFIKIAKAS